MDVTVEGAENNDWEDIARDTVVRKFVTRDIVMRKIYYKIYCGEKGKFQDILQETLWWGRFVARYIA